MGSVRDIAKRAGVSITTVSRVLNNHPRVSDEAREKVLSAANASRYVAHVGRRSTSNIAFLYTGESSLGSPFDAALLQGMSEGMEEYGYDLMVLSARRAKHPHETYTQMFMRKGVRCVVIRTTHQTRHVCEAIAEEGFPSIVVADHFDHPKVNFIHADSRQTSREVVEHLIGLGHTRIACSINVIDDSDHMDRLAGYCDALEQHGLPFDERLVMRIPAYRDGGVQLIKRLITMVHRPTAVFITDPMVAVAAMNQACQMGLRIPEDLSVVGFDDAELRYGMTPGMTAVCQDAVAMGREAFAALQEILKTRGDEVRIRKSLPTWVEIHESTGPAPQITDFSPS